MTEWARRGALAVRRISNAIDIVAISKIIIFRKIIKYMPDIGKWYILYTEPRWEKKVADLLERRKIEQYLPLNRVKKQWADRKKFVLEPLFPSQIFVFLDDEKKTIVKQIDGVIGFQYWHGNPAEIKVEEIATIKKFLNDYDYVEVEKSSVNQNDHIRITNGPLMMWEGQIIEIRTKTVRIYLPSIGVTLVGETKGTVSPVWNSSNLELIFDKSQFTMREVADVISLLSEIYKSVGGDELQIKKLRDFDFVAEYKTKVV